MIEPKNYQVKSFVTERDFWSNNFRNQASHYSLSKYLYKHEIVLNLLVDKEDNFVSINVNYDNGTPFAAFYNPDNRLNNKLYEKVVRAYNKFMSNMKDIFEEVSNEDD